jgi:hypothetical protein
VNDVEPEEEVKGNLEEALETLDYALRKAIWGTLAIVVRLPYLDPDQDRRT